MDRQALVVGIAYYQYFSSIVSAASTAEGVAQILEKYGDFQVERLPTRPKSDGSGEEMDVDGVTYEQLTKALDNFLSKATGKDALIYFIGHGFTLSRILGEQEIQEGYLAPADCQVEFQNNQVISQKNGLILSDFDLLIKRYAPNSLVVFLDCCYSGLLLQSVKSALIGTFISNSDYYLVTACGSSETAKILVSDKFSVFSKLLINGLSKDNADNKGEISGDRLFDFIRREIEEVERNKLQSPLRMGVGGGTILVRYEHKHFLEGKATLVDENGEPICPYQGLQPFNEKQKIFFFGREKQVQKILQKLNEKPFVAVVGASGSGKSSVVRAGLIPLLREDQDSNWQIIKPVKPGSKPLDNLIDVFNKHFKYPQELEEFNASRNNPAEDLAYILKSLLGSGNYLLLIDQFEELFTLSPDKDKTEQRQFIELITQLAKIPQSGLAVVITMRADFLESCLDYEDLTKLIETQSIYLPPLVGKELEDAIAQPALIQGYSFEDELLRKIIEDVSTEKGSLPLLEFALTQLWEKRDYSGNSPESSQNHQLTLEQYQALGGVAGALNKHAEKVYTYKDFTQESPRQPRPPQEQAWIKQIFLKLVQTDYKGKDSRQRQSKAELLKIANNLKQPALSQVLEDLVRGRLLVTGEGRDTDENYSTNSSQESQVIDLAHEALIRDWEKLQDWVQNNRIDLQFRQTIEQEAHNWNKHKHEENDEEYLLLRGRRLEDAEALLKKRFLYSGTEYVKACAEVRDRELEVQLEQERNWRKAAEQKTQLANSRTLLAIASSIGIALLSILAGFQWRAADRGQIEALITSSRATFDSNRDTLDTLSEALLAGKQFQQSLWFRNNSQLRAEVMEVLAQATYWVRERNHWQADSSYINSVSFSPQAQVIVTGGFDKTVKLWSLEGKELQTLTGHNKPVTDVSFSPDGEILASASEDGVVKLWQRDGTLLQDLRTDSSIPVWSVSFSPDGKTIATASGDGNIILWDRQGNRQKTWQGHEKAVYSVSFSRDGQTIATASEDTTVKFWNREGQEIRPPLTGHGKAVYTVRHSPNGQTIATASADGTAILWNSQTGAKVNTLEGHTSDLFDIVFSPDGKTIATASRDNTVKLWNRNGELLSTLEGHRDRVNSLSFSTDGRFLISASNDKTVKLWQPNYSYLIPIRHSNPVRIVNISPDGEKIVTADVNTNISNISLSNRNGNLLETWREDNYVHDVSFSQDSQIVAIAKGDLTDGTVTLRNLEGKLLRTLSKHNKLVTSVDFSHDGKTIATASADKTVKFWNMDGQFLYTLQAHDAWVYSVRFSPDGKTIATTSEDGTAKLWNQDKTLSVFLKGHKPNSPIFKVSFSPDSQLLATASQDDTAILWNQNGILLHKLEGHEGAVVSVDFQTSEGQTIATASRDRTVKLWTKNGRLITTLIGHRDSVSSLRFSPDSKILATASADKTVLLWKEMDNLTLDELMKRGCIWTQDYRQIHPDKLAKVCDRIEP